MTPHSATKQRPMDLFLGFKAKVTYLINLKMLIKLLMLTLNTKKPVKLSLVVKLKIRILVPVLAFWLNNILVVNLI